MPAYKRADSGAPCNALNVNKFAWLEAERKALVRHGGHGILAGCDCAIAPKTRREKLVAVKGQEAELMATSPHSDWAMAIDGASADATPRDIALCGHQLWLLGHSYPRLTRDIVLQSSK